MGKIKIVTVIIFEIKNNVLPRMIFLFQTIDILNIPFKNDIFNSVKIK